MVADALLRVRSKRTKDTELDDEIPAYYVEHVSGIMNNSDAVSTTTRAPEIDDDIPRNRPLQINYENDTMMRYA